MAWSLRRVALGAGVSVVVAASVVTIVDTHAHGATKPARRASPTNTGVPAGTTSTRHDGDVTITKAGTVLKDLDVHGFVIVEASNVTIERSIVRDGVSHGDTAVVKVVSGTNVLVEDTELVPEHVSVQIDGVRGANYPVLRDNIHGTNDGSNIAGDNVTITDSYIHELAFWVHDPDQGGNPAHNDGVEIFIGRTCASPTTPSTSRAMATRRCRSPRISVPSPTCTSPATTRRVASAR